jgi:predicted nucleotidyltransferase component of viral defense system
LVRFRYHIWNGDQFRNKLIQSGSSALIQSYFPNYYTFINQGLSK